MLEELVMEHFYTNQADPNSARIGCSRCSSVLPEHPLQDWGIYFPSSWECWQMNSLNWVSYWELLSAKESHPLRTAQIKWLVKLGEGGYANPALLFQEVQLWRTSQVPEFPHGISWDLCCNYIVWIYNFFLYPAWLPLPSVFSFSKAFSIKASTQKSQNFRVYFLTNPTY